MRGRVPVFTAFDIEYVGSIVKMGTPCHKIGIRKGIHAKIGRQLGDTVKVIITERSGE